MPAQVDIHDRPWMLAIDTSSDDVGLALANVADGELLRHCVTCWPASRKQTETLLTEIDRLLRLSEIVTIDLGAVAVAIGPGSFNALRVGLSTAKALCFSLDIPIFGVNTLDAAANVFRNLGYPVRAFVDAGRNRVVVGDYRLEQDQLTRAGEFSHYQPAELDRGLVQPTVLAGILDDEAAEQLSRSPYAILPGRTTCTQRASNVLEIARERWLTGQPDNLFQLEPVYVHTSSRVNAE